jgi:hypothetical protein|tara:strand:+ start:394 stop:522 length:129 start_codon:yes stop_codon:yes gene_type:complete
VEAEKQAPGENTTKLATESKPVTEADKKKATKKTARKSKASA